MNIHCGIFSWFSYNVSGFWISHWYNYQIWTPWIALFKKYVNNLWSIDNHYLECINNFNVNAPKSDILLQISAIKIVMKWNELKYLYNAVDWPRTELIDYVDLELLKLKKCGWISCEFTHINNIVCITCNFSDDSVSKIIIHWSYKIKEYWHETEYYTCILT